MPKPTNVNRVCFWLPRLWRMRLLDVVARRDGRGQGEFIRAAVTAAIEKAEQLPQKK